MTFALPVRSATLEFAVICLATAISGAAWSRVFRPEMDYVIERPSPNQGTSAGTILDGLFIYHQQRCLSCEYASLHIATTMLADPVSEYTFDDLIAPNDNPHLGYRGSIRGEWSSTDDDGVHSGPLRTALQAVGFRGEAFDEGSCQLRAELDMGRPVIVWLGFRGVSGSFDEYSGDGRRYQLTPGTHVLVV
ncbi:MAG: hypothetical protein WKF81_09845 [Thermomicrobiales bacterium]